MILNSKKELEFVRSADLMMNRGYLKRSIKRKIIELFYPDYVMDYLYHMRTYSYMKHFWYLKPICLYHKLRWLKLGVKLGISIGDECLGYGCVFLHSGTIIIGGSNRIGNYANINTCINIADGDSKIGDFLFLASGAKITKKVILGNEVMISANSVVNKSYGSNILIAGAPAIIKNDCVRKWICWGGYELDPRWLKRYNTVEELKERMCV